MLRCQEQETPVSIIDLAILIELFIKKTKTNPKPSSVVFLTEKRGRERALEAHFNYYSSLRWHITLTACSKSEFFLFLSTCFVLYSIFSLNCSVQ